jgi:site-specific recombinase XerD
MIHLLNATGLTRSSTVHIYTQTIHTTTQLTNLLEGFLGFETRVVKLIGKSAGRAPSLRVIPWHLPYN